MDYRDYWKVSVENLDLFVKPPTHESVFSLSLSTFVEMSAPTAQFSLRTLTLTFCTRTAGLATQEVVNLTESLEEYITKTTLVITV